MRRRKGPIAVFTRFFVLLVCLVATAQDSLHAPPLTVQHRYTVLPPKLAHRHSGAPVGTPSRACLRPPGSTFTRLIRAVRPHVNSIVSQAVRGGVLLGFPSSGSPKVPPFAQAHHHHQRLTVCCGRRGPIAPRTPPRAGTIYRLVRPAKRVLPFSRCEGHHTIGLALPHPSSLEAPEPGTAARRVRRPWRRHGVRARLERGKPPVGSRSFPHVPPPSARWC